MTTLSDLLLKLGLDYVEAFKEKHGHLPVVEKDPEWPSPCVQEEFSHEADLWQPVACRDELSFENVEHALDLVLHPEVKQYFTSLYSESFDATCSEGNLSLLFPWSEKDFERLQENIIGHVLMKQKLKQEVTIFFALTDQEDFILTVDNATGAVWVEQVGKAPHKKLADSLKEFIQMLSPVVYD